LLYEGRLPPLLLLLGFVFYDESKGLASFVIARYGK